MLMMLRQVKRVQGQVQTICRPYSYLSHQPADVAGTVPGGLHLEMTGDDVTECIGGGSDIKGGELGNRYHTHCDPRLNAEQALEMAFFVSSRLRKSASLLSLLRACGVNLCLRSTLHA